MSVLLSSEFQARLSALELSVRRALPSSQRGERRSIVKKGVSVEFADFRAYAPGDDVRHLDWASYARLDQLVLKLYHDEEDLQVHICVDESASMQMEGKAEYARRCAAALAWIALASGNRASVARLGTRVELLPPQRGGAVVRILEFLDQPIVAGKRPLADACAEFVTAARPRGVILLLSDLLDRKGPLASLRHLLSPTRQLSVLQLLSPTELAPPLEGDLRLVDAEDGASVEISASQALLEDYRKTVRAYIAECADACMKRGVAFAQTSTEVALEDFVLRSLVHAGVVA